ncbi:MAG: hypothetical protein KAT77_04320 [Nanoarchaeota archaeon]|nr:hypothetical protein [Nanoarchaeota archaeon]
MNLLNHNNVEIELGTGPVQKALQKMEQKNPSLQNVIKNKKDSKYLSTSVIVNRKGIDFETNQPTYRVNGIHEITMREDKLQDIKRTITPESIRNLPDGYVGGPL